jgi:hypothetical protein
MSSSARLRAEQPHVHRIPRPTSVTIAKRPSGERETREENHIFLKNGSLNLEQNGLARPMSLNGQAKLDFWRTLFLDISGRTEAMSWQNRSN